ncbi:hypothetical protein ACOSQ3_004597 [Xanthoceras sorbifolium]
MLRTFNGSRLLRIQRFQKPRNISSTVKHGIINIGKCDASLTDPAPTSGQVCAALPKSEKKVTSGSSAPTTIKPISIVPGEQNFIDGKRYR